jgi:hypothetical protein
MHWHQGELNHIKNAGNWVKWHHGVQLELERARGTESEEDRAVKVPLRMH